MKKTLITACLIAAGVLSGAHAAHAQRAQEPIIGEVKLFAMKFCPDGYFQADGRILKVADYQPLYSLIGFRFGGNGHKTFALPTLEPVLSSFDEPLLYCIAHEGSYPRRP